MNTANLIACSRMYNANPAVRAHWDDLFTWVSDRAGVALDIISYTAPAPLCELWARPDMGAVLMCGYPFSQLSEAARPVILAAPVCRAGWAGGLARYASHIVTASGSSITSGADLPAAVWGWTVRDSQSGYHAPRAFLAARMQQNPVAMRTVGPLLNPSGIIEALRAGRIEVGAVDAYTFELMSMHEPETIEGLKIIATTQPLPCPMLVSARGAPAGQISALRQVLLHAHESVQGRAVLDPLALERFSRPDPGDYAVLAERADATNRSIEPW